MNPMQDLRFGVVGWGYRGPKIARNLESLPRAMVTMIADADERRLASLASNQSWVEFAERQHCTLMVGHTFQYSPAVNELRKLIQGGDLVASYRFGAITIPHIDWIEPLRRECEDFAHAIRTGARPRANGRVGREVVQVLARIQDALQSQESQAVTTQRRLLAGAETLGV
jgi:predicted dehydrogenase